MGHSLLFIEQTHGTAIGRTHSQELFLWPGLRYDLTHLLPVGFIMTRPHFSILLFSLLSAATLSGCGGIYNMDIQQGNLLNVSQLQQLKTGMNKRQVQYALGAPLVTDPFHKQRWDYYYSFRKGGDKKTIRQRLTLYFQGQKLERIERNGDTSRAVKSPETKVLEQKSSPGFFQRLWSKIKKAT